MSDYTSDSTQSLHHILNLDDAGLSALHDRYYPEVYQFAYYRLHDARLSEPVTHAVFIDLLSEAKQPSAPQRNLQGWLMSCASRRVNDQLVPSNSTLHSEGVTSFQAPQAEMVIDQEAQELSRQKFLVAARRRSPQRIPTPRIQWRRLSVLPGILVAGLLILAMIALIVSFSALPGDRLYPLKRAVEQVRLTLTGGLSQRLETEISFDQNRLKEVQSLQRARRRAEVSLVGGLSQMKPDEWLVSEVPVRILPETRQVGQIEPGWHLLVSGDLQPNGTLLAHQVQLREYQINGKIQRIQDDLWLVDGVPIQVPPEATVIGKPIIGGSVRMKAFRSIDDQLLARWAEIQP